MRNVGAESQKLEPISKHQRLNKTPSHENSLQDMQNTDEPGQTKEPRVRLNKHPLNLVDLTSTRRTLLLRRLRKAIRQRREDRKLPIAHWLEGNLQRECGRRGVDFDVLRPEMPELIGEDDRLVEAFGTGLVALGEDIDVCSARLKSAYCMIMIVRYSHGRTWGAI